ncbi:MAG: hypothetical protein JWL79_3284 [Frankiales bacterium]|nr:hypothetical protein [Frankiales bacterium]
MTRSSTPVPLSDVIGEDVGRPPRRMSTAQKRLAWLAAAIVTTGAAGGWAVGHLREEQRLDQAALQDVAVVAVAGPDAAGRDNRISLTFLNQAHHPVTVLSAHIAGLPNLPADGNSLAPDDPQPVTFALPTGCPAALDLTLASPITLLVRTYRGGTATILITSDQGGRFLAGLTSGTTIRCGLLPPEVSLALTGLPVVRQVGADLLVDLLLRNDAAVPRTLAAVTATDGVTVVASDTPVHLAGKAAAVVPLTLRVTDCSAALSAWGVAPVQAGFTPTYRVISLDGEIDGTVSSGSTHDGHTSLLNASQGIELIARWISKVCPH